MALLDFTSIFFDSIDGQAKAIIHGVSVENALIAFAAAQIPVADQVALTSNEAEMIIRLAKLHKVRIDRASAIGIIETIIANLGGPIVATAGANQIVKYFPGYGNASNAAVAYTLTEMIGFSCHKMFKKGEWFKKQTD